MWSWVTGDARETSSPIHGCVYPERESMVRMALPPGRPEWTGQSELEEVTEGPAPYRETSAEGVQAIGRHHGGLVQMLVFCKKPWSLLGPLQRQRSPTIIQ